MLGAIAGDIIGSIYERQNWKQKDFPLFQAKSSLTDDSILTIATADVILNAGNFRKTYQRYFHRYPHVGYGSGFIRWASAQHHDPYNSLGNGSAMRVSPVGWAFNDLDAVLQTAQWSAEVTHNHPEGIKGAQAIATAIFLARSKTPKSVIKAHIQTQFSYDLTRSLDAIRPTYQFNVSCPGSVPEAILAFLESNDFEEAIRNAISLGGDSDTLACMAGSIAEAFYGGVPDAIVQEVWQRLDPPFKAITKTFIQRYGLPYKPIEDR